MSGLRITGGRLKGRMIALARNGRTRFTSSKVREAVFDLVGDVEGCSVLDLFAGAGSFTVEALSRGATFVTAVEKDSQTAALLRNNLKALGIDKDCLVLNMDVRYAVPMLHRQGKSFDLVYVDPPYEMGYIAATVELLRTNPLRHSGSIVVFEHSKREELLESPGEGCGIRTRKYGDTVLSIITCGQNKS
ncbi:MAG: Ribosomal RNA small subunit methyltransferase D [Syntrophorhabdaceae bacterium PtaU1.Bin034]|jgi:16S rRNA (guanine(966)-N(2))-methyltransferase RsmD|nr:MAG: Ribosomal RNA small subunit methyltransferase D [Syntrophorhabdaceae bacterium PtaU1.Bin034]